MVCDSLLTTNRSLLITRNTKPNFLVFFFTVIFSVITVRSSLALSDGFDDTKTWDENNALDVSDVNDDVIHALNTSTPDEKGERRSAHVQNTTSVPVSSTPPTSALVKKLFPQLKTKKEVVYTGKNAQVATSLLTSCNNLLQQADIWMRSHGLRQLVDNKSCKLSTGLLQVVNRLLQVDYFNRLAACCFNKFSQVCQRQFVTSLILTDDD